jgi:drug/metabolite transporter (DMT)-like permease
MGLQSGQSVLGEGEVVGATPLAATLIRFSAGGVFCLLMVAFSRRLPKTIAAVGSGKPMLIVIAGTLTGPVIGAWLSMYALEGTSTGITMALINTTPIIMIPVARIAYGERITRRSVAGTLLAMAGVALMLLRDRSQ